MPKNSFNVRTVSIKEHHYKSMSYICSVAFYRLQIYVIAFNFNFSCTAHIPVGPVRITENFRPL